MNITSIKPVELNGPFNYQGGGEALSVSRRKGPSRGWFLTSEAYGTLHRGVEDREWVKGSWLDLGCAITQWPL